jgi:hypothetical protein
MKNLYLLSITGFMLFCAQIQAGDSITGNDLSYRLMCLKAASDPYYFNNFRSILEYTHALEIRCEDTFVEYLKKNASPETLSKWEHFQKLDQFGNPPTVSFQDIGKFSGTTLRYIVIADQIKKLFQLPSHAKIVEIGAGFGGQCYILSQLHPISNYYVYDIPEAEALILQMMKALSMHHTSCLHTHAGLPVEKVDLLISNYAFSECDRAMQLDYFERVITKADRGYIIYNQISNIFGLDSLSPNEFISLLKKNGIQPCVYPEPVATFKDNLLIVWDKTKHIF